MSLGPQSFHHELQTQIQRRISHQSPTKYDIDFYQRKITRLENDLNEVQDQLSRARIRLRRAEDYEIKYELIMKQNSNLLAENQISEKQKSQIKSKYQLLKVQLNDKHSKAKDFNEQRQNLLNQVENWKSKYQDSEQQRKNQAIKSEEHVDKKTKRQIEATKRQFIEKQEKLQQQIRQLKKTLHQKQTVENIVTSKVERIRSEKDEQIRRLLKSLENKKQQFETTLKQKNQEIQKLREKFEQVFNFQIQNLRKTMDDQDQLFSIEMSGLRELLSLKNDEISGLLRQVKEQSKNHQKQRDQLQQDINSLRQKIYTIERQNQIQLYNVKERLSKIHSLQIDALQKRYSELINSLKNQRTQLQKVLNEKQRLIEAQRKDMDRIKEQMKDKLIERQARITQLQQRLKETGDLNQNQMKTLHESFHQIQTEKQNLTSQYQNNVGFLNQQISKLTHANQLKTKEVRALHQQISNIKKHHAQIVKDLEDRWKQQRKQRQLQRQKQREKRQKISEDFRIKEKDWKHRQRELQRARQKEERQKNKLQYMVDELQKDIERLNKYNKQLDDTLKQQFKKNQMSTLDIGGARRQLTSELQRQKSQLQAIKRMQVDQITMKFEVELTRLTNQKQKLETDLLKKQLAYNQLQGEFKKLEYINKNIEKINKEKMIEYQKKMATLNNQINLTQNLYDAFLKSKARSHPQSP